MSKKSISTLQASNRKGLNIEIYRYSNKHPGVISNYKTIEGIKYANPVAYIDYANDFSIEAESERQWVYGGRNFKTKVPYDGQYQGTLTIESQIITQQMVQLLAGYEPTVSESGEDGSTYTTISHADSTNFFTIKANTVWQDKSGAVIPECIIFHKVIMKKSYNLSYSGSGDPASMAIVFDILEDDSPNQRSITRFINRATPYNNGSLKNFIDPEDIVFDITKI